MIGIDKLRAIVTKRIAGRTQASYAAEKGYSAQYLGDFLNGRREPGEKILRGEGFERVVLYRSK